MQYHYSGFKNYHMYLVMYQFLNEKEKKKISVFILSLKPEAEKPAKNLAGHLEGELHSNYRVGPVYVERHTIWKDVSANVY